MEEQYSSTFSVAMRYHGYRLDKQETTIRVGQPNWINDGSLHTFLGHLYNNGLLYFDYIYINSTLGDQRRFSGASILAHMSEVDRLMNRRVRSKSFAKMVNVNINFASGEDTQIFLFFLAMIMARLGIGAKTVVRNSTIIYDEETMPMQDFMFNADAYDEFDSMYAGDGTYISGIHARHIMDYTVLGREFPGNQEAYKTNFNPLSGDYAHNYGLSLLRGYLHHTFHRPSYEFIEGLVHQRSMSVLAIAGFEENAREVQDEEGLVYLSFPIQEALPASGLYMAEMSKKVRDADIYYMDFMATVNIEDVHGTETTNKGTVAYSFAKVELKFGMDIDKLLLDNTCYAYEQVAKYNLNGIKDTRAPSNNVGCSIM